MRHKYMTFVMLICVSVCFLWFCGGFLGFVKLLYGLVVCGSVMELWSVCS